MKKKTFANFENLAAVDKLTLAEQSNTMGGTGFIFTPVISRPIKKPDGPGSDKPQKPVS